MVQRWCAGRWPASNNARSGEARTAAWIRIAGCDFHALSGGRVRQPDAHDAASAELVRVTMCTDRMPRSVLPEFLFRSNRGAQRGAIRPSSGQHRAPLPATRSARSRSRTAEHQGQLRGSRRGVRHLGRSHARTSRMYFFAAAKTPIGERCGATVRFLGESRSAGSARSIPRSGPLASLCLRRRQWQRQEHPCEGPREASGESRERSRRPSVRRSARWSGPLARRRRSRSARSARLAGPPSPRSGHRLGEGAEDDQEGDERRRRDVLSVHLEQRDLRRAGIS